MQLVSRRPREAAAATSVLKAADAAALMEAQGVLLLDVV